MTNPDDWTVTAIARRYRAAFLSPVAACEHYLGAIARQDPALRSMAFVASDSARRDAACAADEIASGKDRGPLHGVPFGLVDLIDVAGMPTGCGSRLTAGQLADADAGVVDLLRAAGAIFLGKTTTYEFGTGYPGRDSAFPTTANAWDSNRASGATGAAAAVAAGLLPFAIAVDTGGAVRGSAALCGVAGLKPTFGRIGRHGMFPVSYSLDHGGILARTAEDCAIVLQALSGADVRDPDSVDTPIECTNRLRDGLAGLRIGLVAEWCEGGGTATVVRDALYQTAEALRRRGAQVVPIALPRADLFAAAGNTIYLAECYAIHERDLAAHADLYGTNTRQRIAAGAEIRACDYVNAQRVRGLLTRQVDALFEHVDLLMMPTVPATAPLQRDVDTGSPASPGTMTMPFNVTGNPAISIPCGFSPDGLPIGLQLVARAFADATLLRGAAAVEAVCAISDRTPANSFNGALTAPHPMA